jgi:hypothetical protein
LYHHHHRFNGRQVSAQYLINNQFALINLQIDSTLKQIYSLSLSFSPSITVYLF